MHHLTKEFGELIGNGLRRKSATTCSRWAEKYRIMGGGSFPGPWRFRHHPWLREMHDSDAEMNVGQKSAQVGYTETVLNRTLFTLDVRGWDCLYVLPASRPDASDFSAARFDSAVELSPHLTQAFGATQNVGHKRAGAANLYIRGGRSRSALKSIPVGLIVLDEVDEMPKENVPLAFERQSGQLKKESWLLSTPTAPGFGINERFKDSSQNHFFFPCPSCGRNIELRWPDSIVVTAESHLDLAINDSHYICYECKAELPHESKAEYLNDGKWVESYTDRDVKGWYINQMYSSTIEPVDLAIASIKAQFDIATEQEFYNSKLGLPHLVKGAGVSHEDMEACRGQHKCWANADSTNRIITMGIDVGNWLHFEIDEWQVGRGIGADLNMDALCKVINYGKCRSFDELAALMFAFKVRFAVIDAQPERRKAYEFTQRFYGHARMCSYEQGIEGKSLHLTSQEEGMVKVDRTSWLDQSLGRFRQRKIRTPIDFDEEYREHIMSQVKITRNDRNGNPMALYVTADNKQDHYGHARNYAEIALPLAASIGTSQNISQVL